MLLSGKVRVGNVKVLASSRWSLSLVSEAGGWYSHWEGQWFISDIIAMESSAVVLYKYLLLNILLIRIAHYSNILFHFHLNDWSPLWRWHQGQGSVCCYLRWKSRNVLRSDPTTAIEKYELWPITEAQESWRANDVMKMIDNSVLSLFTLGDGCGGEALEH